MSFQALTIPSAIKPRTPACSTVKNPCSSVSVSSAMRKNKKGLIYRNSFSSFQYARTAKQTMTIRYMKEIIATSVKATSLDIIAFSRWLGQSVFNGPSALKSSSKNAALKAQPFSPLRDVQGFSVKGQQPVIGPVILLFLHRGPAAIVRIVAKRVIAAVNRVLFRGRLPHIGNEVFKAFAPAVADRDALGAVLGITGGRCKMAPLDHDHPNPVKGRPATPVCSVPLSQELRNNLRIEAATGFRVSIPQALGSRKGFVSAVADAVPSRSGFGSILATTNDRQAPKLLTGEINEGRHAVNMAFPLELSKV